MRGLSAAVSRPSCESTGHAHRAFVALAIPCALPALQAWRTAMPYGPPV